MNREAVALGTPVFTVFEGRLGAVDERLIGEGRLRRLQSPEQVAVVKRAAPDERARMRVRRDPRVFTSLLCAPVRGMRGRLAAP
jgi:predicted glycosyltransferase